MQNALGTADGFLGALWKINTQDMYNETQVCLSNGKAKCFHHKMVSVQHNRRGSICICSGWTIELRFQLRVSYLC